MEKKLSYEARTREFESQADADAFAKSLRSADYQEDGGTVEQRSIVQLFIAGRTWIIMYLLLFWVA